MAVTQIRGGVSEGLRVGDGSARRDRPLFPVLQQRATAPESWLPDAGSDPPGGVTFMNGATKRRSAFLESGTLSPNPWDLTLLGRNVWRTVEGTRTEDRAPQGCDPSAGSRAGMARGGFDAEAAPKLQTRPRRILAYCGRKMVLTMGSTSPVDSQVCQIIQRLRSLRPPHAPQQGRLLLHRSRGHTMLVRRLRAALYDAAAAAGVSARIVPHQFRHTYASEMLRAGVSLPAVMKLLGHKSPRMTLEYLEITQQDLQREYRLARSQPRHIAPPPRVPSSISSPRPDLESLIDSLRAAQHVLEMFRRSVAETSARRLLDRLANRLVKIATEAKKLNTPEK